MPLNRRQFIPSALSLALASTWTGVARAGTRRPIKIAVKLGMITGGKSYLEKFEMAKAAGFDGVEPGGPMPEADVEEMKMAIQKTGIVVPGTVCPKGGRQMGSTDEKLRQEGVEMFKTSLRQTQALGGTTVLMYPGTVEEGQRYAEVYENLLRSTREVLPVAEETGVKIALENVWNNLFLSPLDAVRFVDTIGSPWCGWFFDIGNVARFGWPEHWARALGGKRIFKLDIKDYSTKKHMEQGPKAGFECEIGEGDINFPAVMKALDEVGYTGGWISAEVKGGDVARLTDIRKRIEKVLEG
ncbi:hexulose-6-phosphate isomerase [Prosthecobacter fusiformis]|uniref:Hexulose-6-phosphate isomerase n=1 Tax=Prosthecobacter fusiformis TaxID=48464 RepID=A0A4R7STD9_9BACT|nr:sugar phosphate isomerase/epimerase family protein [Prosthecobacter fusiformis]TDU81766.1 hexulose-6-phosphate isomerase [Prosthecobacter fusiformis]